MSEGLKVDTNSAEVMDSHRSVQEFLLYNHPVDCAICDQAGECKLQDYYMLFDHKPAPADAAEGPAPQAQGARPAGGPRPGALHPVHPLRALHEGGPEEPQLGVFGRGNHEYIDIFPGVPLDLEATPATPSTSARWARCSRRDFRFKARAFFLSETPSLCAGCSRGCNTFLDHYDQVSYRYRPRENDAVNQAWMCDDGRVTYHRLNESARRSEAQASGGQPCASEAALRRPRPRSSRPTRRPRAWRWWSRRSSRTRTC